MGDSPSNCSEILKQLNDLGQHLKVAVEKSNMIFISLLFSTISFNFMKL